MTHLCVPIVVESHAQAERDAVRAAEAGADFVEFRIDEFADPSRVAGMSACSPVPAIVTCRSPLEGGRFQGTEEERIATINASGNGRVVGYIDTELATFQRPDNGLKMPEHLILSSHDFKGRPDRLYNILTELNESPANVAKLVWTARTIRDNIEAFEILINRQKPTIALCMGEAGLLSRVLAKKFGGFLTFASLSEGAGTAPGQVTVTDMKRLYRWDALNPQTRVYGVVGSPVAHSMSPALHNAAFDSIGFDGVYLPMLVNPGYESFKAFMESFLTFAPLQLSGLSITIPHKENALRYLKEKGAAIDPLAESIGALNTIVIGEGSGFGVQGSASEDKGGGMKDETESAFPFSGRTEGASSAHSLATDNSQLATLSSSPRSLRGFSTDYAAILDSITSALAIERADLKNYRVAVLGAGGTGRTAVAALAHYGATVAIYNRTREKADALAAEFNGKTGRVVAASMDKLCDSCCQIYLNTTSVGMSPNVDESPFGDMPPKLSAEHLVFDSIYNPMETKLLRDARAQGAKTVSGVEMFVRQAAGQFEAWTGKSAPTDLMRSVVESRLGGA